MLADADAQTPHRWAGKRASEASASTSVNAFELWRISPDVLSRVTDAASNQGLVDARALGHRSECTFPASEQEAEGRYARIRLQDQADLKVRPYDSQKRYSIFDR